MGASAVGLERSVHTGWPPGNPRPPPLPLPPIDPERANILVACVVDYESALLFLDTALDATARGLGASGAVPVRRWTDLVNVAEDGDSFSTGTNRDILYLQRTVCSFATKGSLIRMMSY